MARSSLERRSRAACGHASRRTQQVIDQRCVRPASANDTTTTGTHVSFGDPVLLLLRAASDAWRVFTTPHALRVFRFVVRRGRLVPVASTELSPSDAPVTAHRLPSALSREEVPLSLEEEEPASERPRPPSRARPVKGPTRRMIQSAFHRTGDDRAAEVALDCVSLPLAARSPGFCALPRR